MSPKNNQDPTSSTSDGNNSGAGVQEEDFQEMADVNQSLDQLGCVLDAFEQHADSIMEQLRELLDSNREIRRELELEKLSTTTSSNENDEEMPEEKTEKSNE